MIEEDITTFTVTVNVTVNTRQRGAKEIVLVRLADKVSLQNLLAVRVVEHLQYSSTCLMLTF